jgi:hypothetical protein
MTDQIQKPRRQLAEATILAGLSFAGYAVAFAYEAGFVSRYHIPFWLIQISLTQIFGAIAIITAVAWYSASPLMLPVSPWWTILQRLAVFAGFAAAYAYWIHLVWRDIHTTQDPVLAKMDWVMLIFGGICIFLILMGYLLRWFVQPILIHRGPLPERLATDNPRDEEYRNRTVLGVALSRWENAGYPARAIYTACLDLVILCVVAAIAGRFSAYSQQTFVVRKGVPEFVVIRSYGATLICVELAGSRLAVMPRFRLIPEAESAGVVYAVEALGRLDVNDSADTSASRR